MIVRFEGPADVDRYRVASKQLLRRKEAVMTGPGFVIDTTILEDLGDPTDGFYLYRAIRIGAAATVEGAPPVEVYSAFVSFDRVGVELLYSGVEDLTQSDVVQTARDMLDACRVEVAVPTGK